VIIAPLSWSLGDFVVHMPGFWLLHLLWLDVVLYTLAARG
jgi:hypothetical protein